MSRVAAALRRGEVVYDRLFDEIFPWQARRASSVHWTPVEVAMRASQLLTEGVVAPAILDIGAGIGKFCTIAAVTQRVARVRGLEHRAHFVEIAREAAARLEADVEFVHGSVADHDPTSFNAFYMFNPYGENLAAREDHLDESVELCADRFWRDIAATQSFLARAPHGARVVTYCGWGGTMPPGYELVHRERCAGPIELWRKTTGP
jgi:predicted RNA methylase